MLLRQISIVIGAASLAGCAVRSIAGEGEGAAASEDSEGSSDDEPPGEGTGSSESSSDSSSDSSTDSDSEDSGDPVKFDHPDDPSTGDPRDPPDTDGGELCGPFVDRWEIEAEPPDSCSPLPEWGWNPVCFYPPDGVSCEDEPHSSSQPGALAVAAAYGSHGPGELPLAIAVSLASEGCVAETVSLELLTAALERADDPAVRACLAEMIADEREHVLLAWAALAWLCREFGEPVRVAVARVFGEAERHVGFGATTELPGEPTQMRAHGYLSIPERRAVATRALRELVLPSARTLLRGGQSGRGRSAVAPGRPHSAASASASAAGQPRRYT